MQLLNKRAKQKAANRPVVILDSLVFVLFSNKFRTIIRRKSVFWNGWTFVTRCQTFCIKTIVYLKFSPGIGTKFGLSAARQSVLASQTLHCWAFIKPGKQKPFQHVLRRTCLLEHSVLFCFFEVFRFKPGARSSK